ncbi:hypothetical protein ENKNEFLB_03888 [Nocardioides aquaticus]|uniref:Uncharacterized protein n=1 Tax=Nocardioides aquaticus TaxID=160826 RepID=A0ABX8ELS6_9ACTN|nr:hypothetical protein ENKNEFLB_03888 [Nocardioides aquaticus]
MQAGPEQLADMTDPWSAAPAPSYDVPRGSCPRCGSGEVTHVLAGLPVGPVETPSWVAWVGCMPPGHDRACAECGLRWRSADAGDVRIESLEEFLLLRGAADEEELGDLLSADLELDVLVDTDHALAGELVLVIGRYGVTLPFPTTLRVVQEALDDLEDDVVSSMHSADRREWEPWTSDGPGDPDELDDGEDD